MIGNGVLADSSDGRDENDRTNRPDGTNEIQGMRDMTDYCSRRLTAFPHGLYRPALSVIMPRFDLDRASVRDRHNRDTGCIVFRRLPKSVSKGKEPRKRPKSP